MASISANSSGAVVTFTATASAQRSGQTVTVTVNWTLKGSAYYGSGSLAGTEVASQVASGNVWVDINKSGAKTYTYTELGEKTYSYGMGVVSQSARSGSQATNSGSVSCSVGAATFTVSFNANGGSVSPGSKTVTYGGTYGTLPTPTRSGYSFLGWYTAATGGSKITSSSTVSITANTTLYAHWEPQSILHLVSGGNAQTITKIRVVNNGTVKNVIGVFSVQNGVVKRGK